MSLCITVVTTEGVVAAGDSRQTQTSNNTTRVASDSVTKVFELAPRIVATTSGWGFLKPQGANARHIASHVEDFKPTIANPDNVKVKDVAAQLWAHFTALYNNHIAEIPGTAVGAGQSAVDFTVSGFDPDSRVGENYLVSIPSAAAPATPQATGNTPNSWWGGTIDVVSRIVNGVDLRLFNLPLMQTAIGNANPAVPIAIPPGHDVFTQIGGLRYQLNWYGMTMQDAIDFAVGMIQITTMVQRFAAGTNAQPGAAANVGGPIDVVVVRPGGTVEWIARKALHI